MQELRFAELSGIRSMAKLDEQISTLQQRLQQLKLRQQRIDARKRAIAATQERKADTRRKILMGTPGPGENPARRVGPSAAVGLAGSNPHPSGRSSAVRPTFATAAGSLRPVVGHPRPTTILDRQVPAAHLQGYPRPTNPSCRHTSKATMATAFERLMLRLAGFIGMNSELSCPMRPNTSGESPRVSGPNTKASPVR